MYKLSIHFGWNHFIEISQKESTEESYKFLQDSKNELLKAIQEGTTMIPILNPAGGSEMYIVVSKIVSIELKKV